MKVKFLQKKLLIERNLYEHLKKRINETIKQMKWQMRICAAYYRIDRNKCNKNLVLLCLN